MGASCLVRGWLDRPRHGRRRLRAEARPPGARALALAPPRTLESTADGILVVDNAGRIRAFNDRFVQMWRLPTTILELRDDEKAIEWVLGQVKDPEGFVARIHELKAHPEAESHDLIELVDERFYERYSLPQRIDGTCVGRVWSFRDVTARRAAELDRTELAARISTTAAVAQRQAAELRTIHAGMVDGVVVCDGRGIITLVNEAAIRLTGVSRAEALDRTLDEYAGLLELQRLDGRMLEPQELGSSRGGTALNARTGRPSLS